MTAFDPFGGESVNASMELLRAMPDRMGEAELIKLVLPTEFRRAGETLCAAVDELHPDAVVCLGQAGGRDAVTPERVAVNVMDARIPDNAGCRPTDTPVDPDGPAAYFSALPIRAMAEAMTAAGTPARISDTAGTFVCNSVMYSLLRHRELRGLRIPCGFIHVPCLDELPRAEGLPSLPKETVARGLCAALQCII